MKIGEKTSPAGAIEIAIRETNPTNALAPPIRILPDNNEATKIVPLLSLNAILAVSSYPATRRSQPDDIPTPVPPFPAAKTPPPSHVT